MGFIGIDLHHERFTEARLTVSNGASSITKHTWTFEEKTFRRFLESLSDDDYVLIENTSNAFWFYDLIIDRVAACYVYDTNELRTDGNKTDKIDAEKLAKKVGYYVMMGCDESEFPTVYVPEESVRELRGLITTYRFYNKLKVQTQHRILSILRQNGIRPRRGKVTAGVFAKWIEEIELHEIWKAQIRTLLESLKTIEAQRQETKDMLLLHGHRLFSEQIELLLSIRGFSAFTAIVLMSDIVDVERFGNAKKFCSYLRVAPTTKASNQVVHVGSVNRQSRSTTCTLLTQSVKHFGMIGPHLSAFYGRVQVGKSAGKARIAMIRKILVTAYHMLKKHEPCYWFDAELYARKLTEFRIDIVRLSQKYEEEKNVA